MIEKILEQVKKQSGELLKTKGIVRAYRNRIEIELGGMQARRDAEHAENLRVIINDCHDSERFLQIGIEHLQEVRAAVEGEYAPEQTLEQALNKVANSNKH